MDDEAHDELRELRYRAYGPGADIHHDVVAMERLRLLEAAERAEEDPAADEPERPRVDSEPAERLSGESVAEPVVASQPRQVLAGWSRRRLVWTWAGSLVAAALVGVTASALGGALSAPGDPVQVGSLREEADFVWPEFLGTRTDDARGYSTFLGLTALTTDRQWGGGATDTCLIMVEAAEVDSAAGDGRSATLGCGTAAFPASVQFEVTSDMPAELLERFPLGTELQLVLVKSQPGPGGFVIDIFTAAR